MNKNVFLWYINCHGFVSIKLVYGVYKCISLVNAHNCSSHVFKALKH